ncbi:MAG: histidine kinase, partial [Cyclobacteriaceae bacterium]|nr:histidine kinase [Cyclobacteriaceae bacterium]
MKAKFLSNKFNLLMHFLFWGGYISLSVFVFSGREEIDRALRMSLILVVPQMIIAYINMEFLIPRFLIKKKYLKYAGFVLLCFVGFYLFYEFVLTALFEQFGPPQHAARRFMNENSERSERPFFGPMRRMRVIYGFTQALAIYFLSTAFKTSQIALKREKEAANLKSENLNSELKFLRSQINPHFLFNALNNIYSLSIMKSEKTPEVILKLSDMLRYIIYDCNADRVPLEKEINYINNYIDLQKLKDDQMTNIEVNFEDTDLKCMIAPMILIPFIENSFKHSKIEDIENGWIKLKIENIDNQLMFSIVNSMPKDNYTKDKIGGVGLENVKRRLELLYPKSHKLNLESTKHEFSVKL